MTGRQPWFPTRYATIVADPPWPIRWSTGKTRKNGRGERHVNHAKARRLPYDTMSIDSIIRLGVRDLAAPDAHLYLWTTEGFLIDGTAARVAIAWGFEPKRTLIWRKTGFGLGTFPRPQHETCLIATRGSLGFDVNDVGSVQTWKLVYERRGQTSGRAHSAKPGDFYDLVQRASPDPRIELFARAPRSGWDVWGEEVESVVPLISEKQLALSQEPSA